jgi:hypothetical protein
MCAASKVEKESRVEPAMDKTPRPVAHGSSGSRMIVGKKERGLVDRPIRLLSAASNVAIGAGREIQVIPHSLSGSVRTLQYGRIRENSCD